jgi:hypothetical protein
VGLLYNQHDPNPSRTNREEIMDRPMQNQSSDTSFLCNASAKNVTHLNDEQKIVMNTPILKNRIEIQYPAATVHY